MKNTLLIAPIFFLTTLCGLIHAQDNVFDETLKHHRYQKAKLNGLVHSYHNLIVSASNKEEKEILSQIEYKFPISNDTNKAYASFNGKSYEVTIGTVLSAIMNQLAIAAAIDKTGNNVMLYAMYAARVELENTERARTLGKPKEPRPLKSFFNFFSIPISERQAHYNDPNTFRSADAGYNASIFYIVAHELGHQVNRHLDSYHTKNKREVEQEADAWAFEKMIQLKNPKNVLHLLPLISFYVSSDCLNEIHYNFSTNTHPGWLERYESYVELFHSESLKDKNFVKTLKDEGRYNAYNNQMKLIKRSVSELSKSFQTLFNGCEL